MLGKHSPRELCSYPVLCVFEKSVQVSEYWIIPQHPTISDGRCGIYSLTLSIKAGTRGAEHTDGVIFLGLVPLPGVL